jgi:site-specific DNA-methyltransferase (adenine-specific)
MSASVYIGDNLQIISNSIPDKSISFIYFNPPFGITKQEWDEKLNWKKLFAEFFRVLKDDGVIAIHCSVPFNYTLIREAPKPPTYSWYWKKEAHTVPMIAKIQPLRNTEEILIWNNKKPRYFPQKNGTEITKQGEKTQKNDVSYYGKHYLPRKTYVGKYQTHHIDMPRLIDGFSTRPLELIKLMINSYTQEGDTILDPTCYEGLCGKIAKDMNRKYIGIDKYFFPKKLLCTK